MKIIKYNISFFIIFIGILIISESTIFYLDNFYNKYYFTTFYLLNDIEDEEMKNDIIQEAEYNNIKVFTYNRSQRDIFNGEYEIYGTHGVQEYLKKNSNIIEKKYTSLFLGNIQFKFNDFNSISNIGDYNDYYLIGDEDNILQFKMNLIDKYGGVIPRKGYIDKEAYINTILIWIMIVGLLLLLSIYDIFIQKKECIIKVIMGEKLSKIIFKNIIYDIVSMSASFIAVLIILSPYTNTKFNFNISITSFCILIIINSILYLNLYFYEIKELFGNGTNPRRFLFFNYLVKLISTIIAIFIISSNIMMISQCHSFYSQKEFFNQKKDFYYLKFTYKTKKNIGTYSDNLINSITVQKEFYEEFNEEFNALSLKDISDHMNFNSIIANRNAISYLLNNIKSINKLNFDKEFYFILPLKMKSNSNIVNELNSYIKFIEGRDITYNYEVIYYEDNINIIGLDEDTTYGSNMVKNPAIILNNLSYNQIKNKIGDENLSQIDYLYDIMYEISTDDHISKLNEFITRNELEHEIVQKTNVLDKYNNSLNIVKRVLYINIIFSVLLLIIEFFIINSIISMEYQINSIELAIKKVFGYTIWDKNRKLLLLSIIINLLTIIILIAIDLVTSKNKFTYYFIGGLLIFTIELFTIVSKINKFENAKINNLLKGGRL